jgi:histidinol-phosphatase
MNAFDLDRIGGPRALDGLVSEILAAGEDALRLYRDAALETVRKPDRSPVTAADQAIEARLRAFLREATPDAAFLGEETGLSGEGAALRWVVDPIDGTRAFVRGLPTWSILVGLEADGEPAVGIALLPAAGDLYVAVRGGGAHGNGRPLRLSEVDALEDATIAHGGIAQFTDVDLDGLLGRLGREVHSPRGLHDFDGYRQLLEGRVDAMVDPGVKAWDICAAAVLVREAGGRFTDLSGAQTIHGGSGLASNGPLHPALLGLTRG